MTTYDEKDKCTAHTHIHKTNENCQKKKKNFLSYLLTKGKKNEAEKSFYEKGKIRSFKEKISNPRTRCILRGGAMLAH